MNVRRRGQEDFGKSVADGIRVGSIAIAAYECVASMTGLFMFM